MNETESPRVIVGVTGSPGSLEALRHAVAEARRRGAELTVVHVYRAAATTDAAVMCALRESQAQAAFQRLGTWLDEALGGPPGDLTVRQTVAGGRPPGPVLVDQVGRESALIVVGGRRRLSLRPGGSVADYCSRKASCPVLVVPPPELARELSGRAGRRRLERAFEAELRAGAR